jgi:flagellar hook-associated protein 1 FlgK
MTASIQQLRTQTEEGIATGDATANNALQRIAQINRRLASAPQDSTTATLEDQRDQAITQLAQLMNITVLQNPNNQASVFTANGAAGWR